MEVKKNDVTISQFTYDGDGQRVKSIINSETTYFAGGHYEKKGSEITKYYFAGASRIAVRRYTVPQSTTLNYLVGDHLGSTSTAVNASTGEVVQTRYKPWGEVRWTTENKTLPTRFTFTGQYSYISDSATDLVTSASFGLMFYNARWYDPALGRFAQADTVVPGGVQGLDRYAYVNNSPLRYTDPSGHKCVGESEECGNRSGGGVNGFSIGTSSTFSCDGHGLDAETRALCGNYIELRNHLHEWNPDQDTFTLWDFINLLLSMEFSGVDGIPTSVLQELVVRNFFRECLGHQGHCNSASALNVLTYLASYKHMSGTGDSQHDTSLESMKRNKYTIIDFASVLQTHDESWNVGCSGNAPCEWANYSMRFEYQSAFLNPNQTVDSFWYAGEIGTSSTDPNAYSYTSGGGNFFFIVSVNQINCIYDGYGPGCINIKDKIDYLDNLYPNR